MATLRELNERRSRLVADMRALANAPKGAGGDLSDEQSSKFDSMKAELAGVEKGIDRQRLLDEADRRASGAAVAGTGDGHLDREMRNYSLVRAIASQVPDLADKIDCGRERELAQEVARRAGRPFQGLAVPLEVFHKPVEQRVLTTALPAAGPGSNIIQTDLLGAQYIDRLRAALVTRRLGARVLSGLVGNVDIPKLKTSATSGWVAENAAISATDPEFVKVSLTPKHVGARTEFSRNMLLQSTPDIDELLRDDFAKVLAEAVDRAAVNGGGSNEPTGILANTSLDDSLSMASPSWTGVLQLIEKVQVLNSAGSAFLTHPRVVRKLRSTVRVASTDSRMIMESPTELAGFPLLASTITPDGPGSPTVGTLVFGDFSELLLGYWSELDLLVNPYESTAYSKGNIQVRGIITMDVQVRHIESFSASTDVSLAA